MTHVAWLSVALCLSLSSDPYVRSRAVTPGQTASDEDHCLWWSQNEIAWQQNQLGNPETTGDTEFDAVRRSVASWQAVNDACGHLKFTEGALTTERTVGYDASSSNVNLVLFRQKDCEDVAPKSASCWSSGGCGNTYDCWENPRATIALTTATYDPGTGRVLDADIELNAANFIFTTVDAPKCPSTSLITQSCVATDVQNTVTHELGHFLGLDHTAYPNSTMNPTAPLGETSKRTIDSGSAQFICDVYPKGKPARDCVIHVVKQDLGQQAGCSEVPGLGLFGAAWLSAWLLRKRGRA